MEFGIATAVGVVATIATGVCLGMLGAWFVRALAREVWQAVQSLESYFRG